MAADISISHVDDPHEQSMADVWTRTARKYRVRAVVLLIVNLVLFAGLACFAYWIREGEPFAPAVDGYWGRWARSFAVAGDATLANFTLFPIRIDLVPMHGVVVGLMLAALVSIPILITILYRFPCSIPFILAVAFLAVMPWLAITLTGACMLAGFKRLRFGFRYASALLGLLLVVVYFYGASRQTPTDFDAIAPQQRLKLFIAPWVLATIASCVIMGLVLGLAKLVNYRPGVVAPLLLASFLVPMALFARYVGPDELYFRLLERHVRDATATRDLTDWFDRRAQEAFQSSPSPRPDFETFRANLDLRLQLELDSDLDPENAFAEQMSEVIGECKWFLRQFPDSRYAPNALYFKGRAQDMRVDESALLTHAGRKELRYYDDFPRDTPAAELTWEKVVYNAPRSSVSAVGRYKLAMLDARHGEIEQSIARLNELIGIYDAPPSAAAASSAAASVKEVLQAKPPDDSLRIAVDRIVRDAKLLRALIENNADDPRYGVRPLCGSRPGDRQRKFGLLELDPRHQRYKANLVRLISQDGYPDCLLLDNVSLMLAQEETDLAARVEALESCRDRFSNGDAFDEITYRLAVAYHEQGKTAEARSLLEQLIGASPDGLWSGPARERLRVIAPAAGETTSAGGQAG